MPPRREAPHDNSCTTLVMEQPDGTLVAWARFADAICVDYCRGHAGHAPAAVMLGLKRKYGDGECAPQCGDWEVRMHTTLPSQTD
jgi:hypothetical protein